MGKKYRNGEINLTAPEELIKNLKPKGFLMESSKKFITNQEMLQRSTCVWDEETYNNMYSQMNTVQKVCEITPDDYDVYILIRYDVKAELKVELESLDMTKVYQICNDHIQIFGRNTLLAYSNVFNNIDKFQGKYIDAESLRNAELKRNNIEFIKSDTITFERIRAS